MKPDEELTTTKEVVDRIKWLQNQASIGWSNATLLHLAGENSDELCGSVEAYEARTEALLGRLELPTGPTCREMMDRRFARENRSRGW